MATGHCEKRVGVNGDVSYQVVVEEERDPITGKRRRHYKTVKGSKKSAEAVKRKMINEVENGGIAVASTMRVEDWMDRWLTAYLPNIEETTRNSYKEKVKNHIAPDLGDIRLKALNTTTIQLWVNSMTAQGLSPKTIKNTFNILHAALKKAVILRMIPYTPCDGVELPKLERHEVQVYDTNDIKLALSAAEGTDMYLPVMLLLSVGLRRGELLALRWENIDFDKRVLHICENRVNGGGKVITKAPKTKSGNRKIIVGYEVISTLKQAKVDYDAQKAAYGPAFHDLGFVIRKADGSPYHPDAITKKWYRFTKKNNLTHIRLHDLRHTNATQMIGAGIPTKVVSERLGHADVTTTLRVYVHTLPEMNENAAAAIDNILFSNAR